MLVFWETKLAPVKATIVVEILHKFNSSTSLSRIPYTNMQSQTYALRGGVTKNIN